MGNKKLNIEVVEESLVKGKITKGEFLQLKVWSHQSKSYRCYVRDLNEIFFSKEVLNGRMLYEVASAINSFYLYVSKLESISIPSLATILVLTFGKE